MKQKEMKKCNSFVPRDKISMLFKIYSLQLSYLEKYYDCSVFLENAPDQIIALRKVQSHAKR